MSLYEQKIAEMDKKEISKEIWDCGRRLQIDSYATGRPQAGIATLHGDYIHLEVTDGSSVFRGKIPLPPNWKP